MFTHICRTTTRHPAGCIAGVSLWLLSACVACWGCAPPNGAECVPGHSVECACIDGARGAQTCSETGDAYGRCECAVDEQYESDEDENVETECGDWDGTGNPGCGKVDFLFVIDNSASMENDQRILAENFPQFMETIQATLSAQDYHIMVVDSDSAHQYDGSSGCENLCDEPASPNYCRGYSCGDYLELGPCDMTLGAGITHPIAPAASNQFCDFEGGNRYLMNGDPRLTEAFACAAQVGASGNGNEAPIGAMLAAVSPEMNAHRACNEGFLRPDAILVVVILSDATGQYSVEQRGGDPAAWRQALLDAKCGREEGIVVLGLLGDSDLRDGECEDPIEASPRLRQFVELFGDRGFLGSICEPDYGPFFSDAVNIIDTACDEYVVY